MRKFIYSFCFFFLICNYTFGQSSKSFIFFLNEVNLKYEQPKNYIFLDSGETLKLKAGKIYSSAFHSIKNSDKNIVISFVLIPISAKLIRDPIAFQGLIVPNPSYLSTVKNQADSVVSKPFKIDSKALKILNVDAGFTFDALMDSLYREIYTDAEVVILHKQNIGDIKLFYFYNEKSKKDVELEIKRTFGMIKFRPNEVWNPHYK